MLEFVRQNLLTAREPVCVQPLNSACGGTQLWVLSVSWVSARIFCAHSHEQAIQGCAMLVSWITLVYLRRCFTLSGAELHAARCGPMLHSVTCWETEDSSCVTPTCYAVLLPADAAAHAAHGHHQPHCAPSNVYDTVSHCMCP